LPLMLFPAPLMLFPSSFSTILLLWRTLTWWVSILVMYVVGSLEEHWDSKKDFARVPQILCTNSRSRYTKMSRVYAQAVLGRRNYTLADKKEILNGKATLL
jgi:hypothetical protein